MSITDIVARLEAIKPQIEAIYVDAALEDIAFDVETALYSATSEIGRALTILAKEAERCPGCGARPGDGLTATCNHPMGCGFARKIADDMARFVATQH